MDARLTHAQIDLLHGLADALDRTARHTGGVIRTIGLGGNYQLGEPVALTYVADLIRTALTAEPEATSVSRLPSPTAIDTADQLRHALVDHLDAGTSADTTVYISPTSHPLDNGLTIGLGVLADALADAAGDVHLRPQPEPETKPTDLAMAVDPDPYGIDLRGPHGTLTGADRATLGGLADLDPRTRGIFEQLLRVTLDNLDRATPTTPPLNRGGNLR